MDPAELLKQLGIDLVKDAENFEPVEGEYEFKMFTRDASGAGMSLKTFVEKDPDTGEDEMFIAGVASSTIKDLHGDTMLPSALIDMERQANNNLTIFLNHEYKVPKDVAGSVVAAKISSSANDPETGAPIYDLDFERIRINKENPDAVQTFKALQPKGRHPGTKLGLSIGARIPEGGAIRNKKTGALLISHVLLLETSIVSIPANPRSWIQNAVKSLRAGPTQPATTITLEVEPPTVVVAAAPEPTPTPEPEPTTAPEPVAAAAPEPVITAAAPSQGAPQSEPGADGAAPVVTAAVTPPDSAAPGDLVRALVEAQSALAKTTTDLIASETARREAETKLAAAVRERDAVAAMSKDVLADTAQLIRRLERLPVGQKASFRNIASDFDSLLDGLSDVYAPGVIETLKQLRSQST